MIAHAIVGFILMALSAYGGYRYGARAVSAVKAELAKIEADYAYVENDVKSASLALSNEIKAVVTRIRKIL